MIVIVAAPAADAERIAEELRDARQVNTQGTTYLCVILSCFCGNLRRRHSLACKAG